MATFVREPTTPLIFSLGGAHRESSGKTCLHGSGGLRRPPNQQGHLMALGKAPPPNPDPSDPAQAISGRGSPETRQPVLIVSNPAEAAHFSVHRKGIVFRGEVFSSHGYHALWTRNLQRRWRKSDQRTCDVVSSQVLPPRLITRDVSAGVVGGNCDLRRLFRAEFASFST